MPPEPDVAAVNKLGGYSIAYDRLAIIDGQGAYTMSYSLSAVLMTFTLAGPADDPWRGDTPHSPAARPRADTTLRPFKLIPRECLVTGYEKTFG